jgi:hypothetical protein
MRLTFDRSAAQFVLNALDYYGRKLRCTACGGDITPDNFAGAVGRDLYCDQLPCLIHMGDSSNAPAHASATEGSR